VLIVGTDRAAVEIELTAWRLACPDCQAQLRPWGHASEREVRGPGALPERRRPRRSICRSCETTHVLAAEDTLRRRRDTVEVIGAALVAKAAGKGRRSIAAALGLHPSTVAGWLRRFALMAGAIREHFTRWAAVLGPGHGAFCPTGSAFSDAVEAIGVVGIVAVRRFGPRPVWSLASLLTGGGLLATRAHPYPPPV
jgi:transposase-like protein